MQHAISIDDQAKESNFKLPVLEITKEIARPQISNTKINSSAEQLVAQQEIEITKLNKKITALVLELQAEQQRANGLMTDLAHVLEQFGYG